MIGWRYIASKEVVAGEVVWTVRELYENDEGEIGWTEKAVNPVGYTRRELKRDLGRMRNDMALDRILDLTVDPPELRKRGPEDDELTY